MSLSLHVAPVGLCSAVCIGLRTVQPASSGPGGPHPGLHHMLCRSRVCPTPCLLQLMQNQYPSGTGAGSQHALGFCVMNQNIVESISWVIEFVLGERMCPLAISQCTGGHSSVTQSLSFSLPHSSSALERQNRGPLVHLPGDTQLQSGRNRR